MYNEQNNNSQYGNSTNSYPYNNVPPMNGNTQYNGSMQPQNTGYPANPNPQYGYSQNGYTQYPQQTQFQTNYQYGSNLNTVASPAPKKNKKKLLLIGVLVLIVVIVIVILFLGKGKKGNKKPNNSNSNDTQEATYKKIMEQYGSTIETKLADHKATDGTLPTKESLLEESKIEGYTIECRLVDIYTSGKVYLDKCKINDSEEIYSYGQISNDEEVMQDYGKKALTYVSNYFKINKVLPSKIDMKYDEKVQCDTVNIYNDKTIYLGGCSINDSNDKYSYGYLREDGYLYISYTGANNEVIGETTTADFESSEIQKKKIKCDTNTCKLEKSIGSYAVIKEEDGRTVLYNVGLFSNNYTIANNVEYAFVLRNNAVYGLLLRNQNGEEALYSLVDNAMKYEYGKYYYVWNNPTVETKSLLMPVKKVKNGKSGLISLNSNKEVLAFEYDTMFFDSNYINVTKDGKRGLLTLDKREIALGGKFYDDFVLADYQEKYALVYDKDQLQVMNLQGKLIKKVAEIPKGYAVWNDNGSGMQYKDENGKAIFTAIFKTNKPGNPCARYTYNLTTSNLKIDENKCEAFKS